ncbi:SusC/RagA family TonB-linked outer membrane protein [Cellulophaga baltica]|uniref:SusC/RagA family TonB-linked outer membrane protein n=1 Tax=Cellulophaga baltica TaxID=76594 RepID=UPI0021486192|nr:SusC/RagA family TonB-linked outer membrane protein [Cellulophaga baltica]MCR1026253.1 SusC/RagA family TonB-linked outer membrane protein [Cellulophaga baltica]
MNKRFYKFFLIMLFVPLWAISQEQISGLVTDQTTGDPLPGVSIILKGTTKGVSTDFDGNYTISANQNDILQFSYIGYKSIEEKIAGITLNVSLETDTQLLEEVVLIGYGSAKKEDLTGSVDVLSSKDFNQGSVVSADQLLTGKMAGVRITSNGGQPDAAPNIRIRGGSSLSANNSPLIVIDGIPVDNTNPAGVGNPLSLINPNDIESFSVLKDASATAIYGSRASNGVIIIATKKGTSGEVKFNFTSDVSVSNVASTIDVMDSDQYVNFISTYHPSFTNLLGVDDPNTTVTDNPLTAAIEGRIIGDTNWQDEIFRTAISTNTNFSARANLGGKIPFRGSIGYTNTGGVVKTNDYERVTLSLKLTPAFLDDHLKVSLNAKGLFSDKNAIDEGGALGGAINMDPTKPVLDTSADNRFGGYYQNTIVDGNRLLLDGQSNPLALLKQRQRPEQVARILASLELDYKLHALPELRAVLNLGLEASKANIEETYLDNSIATYRFNNADTDINTNYVFNPGVNYTEDQDITNTTLDAYLVYTKEFESFVKRFEVQGGYSYQNFENDGTKKIFRYDDETGIREELIDPNNLTNRYFNVLNLQSFFGRTNIDLANQFLVTLSFRADGSSLFTKENRWGYFPAAAVAWKIGKAGFVANSNTINDLKLRLGAGKTGQQDITGAVGYYPSSPLFEIGSTTSQYLAGVNLYSAKAFNPDLTWEKTTTYNVGLDFDLFAKGIMSGSVDFYQKETKDLLAKTAVPPGQALSDAFVQNVGETESKGFEVNLNINPITTENFRLEFNSNVGYNRSEVTSLKDVTRITASESGLPTGTGVSLAYHTVGYQPYSAWVFKQVYDLNGDPISNAFVDINGDNIINNDDRYYETLRPNWTFGFGLNLNYKNWDLSSSFRGQIGGQVFNARRLTSGWIDRAIPNNSNSLSNVLDFNSDTATTSFVNVQGNIPFSDYFLEDASFLRMENIVIGFRVPNFLKDASLRIYGAANNLFVISDYSGQDPENFNAIDNNFYPRPRVFTLGLNLDF